MNKLLWIVALTMIAGLVIAGEGKKQQRGHGREHHENHGSGMEEQPSHIRGGGRGGMHGENMMINAIHSPMVAEKIGLSEKQRKKIEKKMQQIEKTHLELKQKMKKAALKQARLMTAKKLDQDALMSVIEETGRYRTQMAKERVKLMIFMRQTLTPEQTKAVHGMMRKRMKERRKMCGKKGTQEERRVNQKEIEKSQYPISNTQNQ